jgi:hypothetical protein
MTDPRAAQIIDRLLALIHFGDQGDAHYDQINTEAMLYLLDCRNEHPGLKLQITQEMAERGMLT